MRSPCRIMYNGQGSLSHMIGDGQPSGPPLRERRSGLRHRDLTLRYGKKPVQKCGNTVFVIQQIGASGLLPESEGRLDQVAVAQLNSRESRHYLYAGMLLINHRSLHQVCRSCDDRSLRWDGHILCARQYRQASKSASLRQVKSYSRGIRSLFPVYCRD